MSDTEGTPARRSRLHRAATPPRVEDLDALLRDVDSLRLTLETDLTLAASAVEAGEPGLAADILDADRAALGAFESRALGRLTELEAGEAVPVRRRSWVPTHAGSLLVAAALVGVLAGVVPQAISNHPEPSSPVAATDSLARIQQLVLTGDPSEIRAASAELHEQLASVVATAGTDPAAAQNALLLLTYEQSVIAHSADRTVLADVLRQSEALATRIRDALPASARAAVPAVAPAVAQTADAAPSQSPSPAPKASPSASPKPSPKPSTTSSPSSNPSASPSSPYTLPTPPIAP